MGELRKHQLLEIRVRCYAIRHERLTCNSPDEPGNAAATAAAAAPLSGIDGSTSGGASPPGEPDAKCPDQVFFQCHSMRLQHPDDELGGNMLLVIPQVGVCTAFSCGNVYQVRTTYCVLLQWGARFETTP